MTRQQTPPDIKWLVNERAAVAGELATIDAELERLARRKKHLLRVHLALGEVYPQLAPTFPLVEASPVNAHTRYGGRGHLIEWVRATLRAAHPCALDTASLTEHAAQTFGIPLASRAERNRFRQNSLRGALRKLLAQDEVERLHDFQGVPHLAGVWRWKPGVSSIADLAAAAEALEVT
jgi:hypothetical protein